MSNKVEVSNEDLEKACAILCKRLGDENMSDAINGIDNFNGDEVKSFAILGLASVGSIIKESIDLLLSETEK